MDQLLHDKLVVGIQDSVMSKRLQMDPDLTLKKAKKMVHQKEAVKDHRLLGDGKQP